MIHIFLSFLFYNIILYIFYAHYRKGDYYISKSALFKYTFLLILFAVYGGGEGDYFKYKEIVEGLNSLATVLYSTSLEIQYNYLAYFLDCNYNLWRLVLYSVQFIGMSWFLYKAKLNTYPVFLCFITLCLVSSVYGRAFWGAIYFFMGVYLMIDKKNPLYLIAIVLCYVSHSSNLMLLFLVPLGFVELKRWHFVLVLLLFGTIVSLLKESFISLINSGGIEGAEHLNDRIAAYSEAGEMGYFGNSFGEIIAFILKYVPIFIILIYILYVFFKSKNAYLQLYKPYRRIINVCIGLVLVSIVVLLASVGSGTLFYRILGMIIFPISIILPYMENIKFIKRRTFNNYIWIFIVSTEFGYMKDFYYAYAHGI